MPIERLQNPLIVQCHQMKTTDVGKPPTQLPIDEGFRGRFESSQVIHSPNH